MERLESHLEDFFRLYDGKKNPAPAAKAAGLTSRGASFANRTLDRILLNDKGERFGTTAGMYEAIAGDEVTAAGLVSLNTVSRVRLVNRGTIFGCWAVCVASQSDDPEFELSEDEVFVNSKQILANAIRRAEQILLLGETEGASWVSEGLAARGDSGRMLAALPGNIFELTEGQLIRLCDMLGYPDRGPNRADMDGCRDRLAELFPNYRVYDMLKPVWIPYFVAKRDGILWKSLTALSEGNPDWRDGQVIHLKKDSLLVA